jgi:phospholipase D1/2
LKDTYLAYLNPFYNNSLGFIMLVDRAFECKTKSRFGAYHSIVIKNEQRSLVLKCKNAHQQREWYERIQHMLNETGKHFHRDELLPFGSYAPRRANQLCKWYVNASLYMEHVMSALNNAREEIYIADWWLCPELFLKRPTDDLQFRLDKILLKKAKEGVKVYILLFKEVSFALGLMSSRAKNLLTQNGKNPNIKVLRHPEHSPAGVFLWSHHEKCVIIDQSIAFMGGVDLCFGRWDDDLHR